MAGERKTKEEERGKEGQREKEGKLEEGKSGKRSLYAQTERQAVYGGSQRVIGVERAHYPLHSTLPDRVDFVASACIHIRGEKRRTMYRIMHEKEHTGQDRSRAGKTRAAR